MPVIEERGVLVCAQPVFVVGSPRSGTSILPWSLAQHTAFWTSRESDLLFNLFGKKYPGEKRGHLEEVFALTRERPEGTWLDDQKVTYEEFMEYLGLGLNALFTSRSKSKRWIDQTPVNTAMLDSIAALFPESRFLHILRDGRSVVHSMVNFGNRLTPELRQSMMQHGTFPTWSTNATVAARTWRWFVELALDFQARQPARCLAVLNEELSADPVGGFRRILMFLGADYEDGPAEYFRSNRINSSFEGQAPPPREPWNDWPHEQRQAFVEEAGGLMVKLELATVDELDAWAGVRGATRIE